MVKRMFWLNKKDANPVWQMYVIVENDPHNSTIEACGAYDDIPARIMFYINSIKDPLNTEFYKSI